MPEKLNCATGISFWYDIYLIVMALPLYKKPVLENTPGDLFKPFSGTPLPLRHRLSYMGETVRRSAE